MIGRMMEEDYSSDIHSANVQHIPVMKDAIIENFHLKSGGVYVDCTLGLGGHAKTILEKIGPHGLLIGIDRDARSLVKAKESLHQQAHQCNFVQDDYRNIKRILEDIGVKEVDGILIDLGISSYQLNDPDRGFSLQHDGPLDMRMDQASYISAFDLVNSLSEKELSMILKDFGEERWHNRIAHNLVLERAKHPIETTKELRRVVLKSLPANQRHERIHPATRTFQAFRIAVNRELESLDLALDQCIGLLKKGGRIAVISFHSLEDRIVKRRFKQYNQEEILEIITKKPLRPTEAEIKLNPRSRSAKLRVGEKIK